VISALLNLIAEISQKVTFHCLNANHFHDLHSINDRQFICEPLGKIDDFSPGKLSGGHDAT
jgi:hypothetical protein